MSELNRRGEASLDGATWAPILSATGQVARGRVTRIPRLRLGGVQISGYVIAFADLHAFDIWGLSKRPAILIGVDFLRRFDWVALDYDRANVSFRPPGVA